MADKMTEGGSGPLFDRGMLTDFFSAADLRDLRSRHAVKERQSALQARQTHEEEKKRRISLLKERREVTPQLVQRAVERWRTAAMSGEKEVEVIRFPSELCTDDGRAINNGEEGWPSTLVGVPAQIYEIWNRELRAHGFGLKAYIVEFPDDRPGDVAMFVTWG